MVGVDLRGEVVAVGETGVDRIDVVLQAGQHWCHGLIGVGPLRFGERLAEFAHPAGALGQISQRVFEVKLRLLQDQSLGVAPLQAHVVLVGPGGADVAAPKRNVDAQAEGLVAGGKPAKADGRAPTEDAASLEGQIQRVEHVPGVVGRVVIHSDAYVETGDLPEAASAAVEPLISYSDVSLDPQGGDAHHRTTEILGQAEV